jgi:hypothetical protein
MVPCVSDCGRDAPGAGLFDISHLLASRSEGHRTYPCPRCAKWQDIDGLLVSAGPDTDDQNRLVRAVQKRSARAWPTSGTRSRHTGR